jgi:DNA-binding GntR family transcriptional regulator
MKDSAHHGQEEALRSIVDATAPMFSTAEDRIGHVLRMAIDRGVFHTGERLQQDRLAALLGVSRTPIRAALRQLESEGYVTLEPHRGAQVRTVSESELQDLYEIRILVESFALRRVAHTAAEGELNALSTLAAEIDSTPVGEERTAQMNDFYRTLYTLGNSAPVVELIMQLRAEVTRHGSLASHRHEPHRELLEALAMGDPDLAAAWLAAHLRTLARQASAPSATGPTAPDTE